MRDALGAGTGFLTDRTESNVGGKPPPRFTALSAVLLGAGIAFGMTAILVAKGHVSLMLAPIAYGGVGAAISMAILVLRAFWMQR